MIVATAGHVDHGKTSLVRRLTGVDTDRLEEEKHRGLSINLGFAYRPLNAHTTLGFVDVPGHTRFINTMISGVGGIDLGMLVVAADDGVMPQTLEHLDVMRLLGIREFIAVISKIDRVDPQRAKEVATAVCKLLSEDGSTPVFAISNTSGTGVEALSEFLQQRALAHRRRSAAGHFRLSVDRAFVLKGTGLVLTGTALAGAVAVGDALQLQPPGIPLRVRSLHVDDRPARRGQAGERCALNVSGNIHREQVNRGDMLAADPAAPVSERLDARVSVLPHASFAIKHLTPVTLHIGAGRTRARLYLLENSDKKHLAPGAQALVQLILAQPLACCRGDRFLLRDDSESFTLGGGMVLDPLAPRTGKARSRRLHYLAAMAEESPRAALRRLLNDAQTPVNLGRFSAAWNLCREQQQALRGELDIRCFDAGGDEYAVTEAAWEQWEQELLSTVQERLQSGPGEPGIKATALQAHFATTAPASLFRPILSGLLHTGALTLSSGLVATPGYEPSISGAEQDRWHRLGRQFEAGGLRPPLLSELVDATGLERKQVLSDLQSAVRRGRLVKVNDDRYALPRHMAEHAAIITELEDSGAGISVVNFRDRIGGGRRLAIEILEYFDGRGFTQRRGEGRVIVNPELPRTLFSQ